MQHDQSKITSQHKVESKVRSTKTPDRSNQSDTTTSSVASPRRRLTTARQSSASLLNTTSANLRKLEVENYNLDLELTYNDYVASHIELILENQTLKKVEKSFSNSMKNLCKETKTLNEKHKEVETRIIDTKAASCLSDYQEKIILYMQNLKDNVENYEIKSILSQLEQLLNRFNILRCENITLPANAEEIQEFIKVLTDCYTILQKISDPTECEALENFAAYHKEFTTISQEILNLKKIIEEEILNVQSETLKTCSHMFAQNDI